MPAENPDKASIPAAPNAGASGGTIGQAQPVRVEANEPENNSGPQGWTPTEDPYKAFIPAAPKVGAPGATVDQAQPARAEVDEPENKSGVQGWTPTEDPYKAFKAATTPTRPAAMAAPPIPGFGAIGSVSALMNNMEGDPAPRAFYGRSDLNRQLRSSKVPPSLAPMLTPPPGLDN
jgi:hypothetical protein